jgi:hypothetical protein
MSSALRCVLVLSGALLSASCGDGDEARRSPRAQAPVSGLVGVWTLDGPGSVEALHEFIAATARQELLAAAGAAAEGPAMKDVTAADVEARTRTLEDSVRTLHATLEFRADHTWTARGRMGLGGGDEVSSGTWIEKEGRVVAPPTHEEGERAAGRSALPMVLVHEGRKLRFEVPGAPTGAGLLFERR